MDLQRAADTATQTVRTVLVWLVMALPVAVAVWPLWTTRRDIDAVAWYPLPAGMFVLMQAGFLAICSWRNHTRYKRKQFPHPPAGFRAHETATLVLFEDTLVWRVGLWGVWLFAAATTLLSPVTVSRVAHQTFTDYLVGFASPVVAMGLVGWRARTVFRQRAALLQAIHDIARAAFKYPRVPAKPRQWWKPDWRLQMPWWAIRMQWVDVIEPDEFTVRVPATLSVNKAAAFREFGDNINAKLYDRAPWRVNQTMTGANRPLWFTKHAQVASVERMHMPADMTWSGQSGEGLYDFVLGYDLTHGKPMVVTLGNSTPNAVMAGGGGSGKTTAAEVIMLQALVAKTMPWDPGRRWKVIVVDPSGNLTERWRGRPNVAVATGNDPGVNSAGEAMTGGQVMAAAMSMVAAEMKRRMQIMGREHVAKWDDLDDDVKRSEQLEPWLLVVDEFLDIKATSYGDTPEVAAENNARRAAFAMLDTLGQQGRKAGIRIICMGQRMTMGTTSSVLMTNLHNRFGLGTFDGAGRRVLFGSSVPGLPNTLKQVDPVTGNMKEEVIPGRSYHSFGVDTPITTVQFFGIGQGQGSDLDQWLPQPAPADQPVNGDLSFGVGEPYTYSNATAVESPVDVTDLPFMKPIQPTVDEPVTDAQWEALDDTDEFPAVEVDASDVVPVVLTPTRSPARNAGSVVSLADRRKARGMPPEQVDAPHTGMDTTVFPAADPGDD